MDAGNQTQSVVEINLAGKKMDQPTSDLNLINQYGKTLYEQNKDYIKEKVRDNWFAVIDPTSGTFIASLDPVALYTYTREKYPNKLFYYVGLIKNYFNFIQYE